MSAALFSGSWTYLLALALAAGLEIWANLLLLRSNGFRRLRVALPALLLVGLSFTCLAYAVRGMDLAVAYAIWGGLGIVGTCLGGWIMSGQRLNLTGWAGLVMLLGGMALLKLA